MLDVEERRDDALPVGDGEREEASLAALGERVLVSCGKSLPGVEAREPPAYGSDFARMRWPFLLRAESLSARVP